MGAEAGNIIAVIAIIVVAGAFGGLAAFLTDQPPASAAQPEPQEAAPDQPPADAALPVPQEAARRRLARFVILGIVAAACIPLFLHLVSSGLTNEMFKQDTARNYEAYLVFGGMCLIAAFSARRFIDSISSRVLQQVEELREQTDHLRDQTVAVTKVADDARKVALDVADEQDSPVVTPEELAAEVTESGQVLPEVTGEERDVLEAASRKRYRNSTGIATTAGIEREQAKRLMERLRQKGLLEKETNPATDKVRWYITDLGKAVLRKA